MKPVTTIDDFPIQAHIDWAKRQEALAENPLSIQEASEVSLHPSLLGHEAIYLSQWEFFLEWNRQKPWAHFEPPPKYRLASRRLFSFRILPYIEGLSEKSILQTRCFQDYPCSLFETEKAKMLNLITTAEWLNELLAKISAFKLKYQKG